MLKTADLEAARERSTRAEPLDDAGAKALLGSADRVIVCRGKKSIEIPARQASLDDLKGPTGKVRAPLLHVENTLLVGFNRETLEQLVGG